MSEIRVRHGVVFENLDTDLDLKKPHSSLVLASTVNYIARNTKLEKVYGCSNQASNAIVASSSAFCRDKRIIFAWALKASPLGLPDGAAIAIGGHSNVNSIQVECHYKEIFNFLEIFFSIENFENSTRTDLTAKILSLVYLLRRMKFSLGCPYNFPKIPFYV